MGDNMVAELDCEIEDVLHVMRYKNYGRFPPNICFKVNKVMSRNGIEFYYGITKNLRYDISNEDYTNIKNSVPLTFNTNDERCLLLYNKTKDYMIDKFSEGYSIEFFPNSVCLYAKYKDVIVRISTSHIARRCVNCTALAVYVNKLNLDKQVSNFYNDFGSEQEVEYYDDVEDETYYEQEFVSHGMIDIGNIGEANHLIKRYFDHHEEINKIINFVIDEEDFIKDFNEINRIIHLHLFPEKQPVRYRVNIVDDLSNM